MKRISALLAASALSFAPVAAPAQSKISALPAGSAVSATDVFPATQGACPGSCATNGVTGAQLKTWAQSGLSAGSLSNGTTGSGAVVLASSPSLATPTLGVATATTLGGAHAISSITLGSGSQVGAGATAVCATSHVCDSLSGEVTLTTGTGTLAAGLVFTVVFADTRSNIPNCVVGNFMKAGPVFGVSVAWTETTSTVAVTSASALAASTAYNVDYVCGGK